MKMVFFEAPIDIITSDELYDINCKSIFSEEKNNKFIWLLHIEIPLSDYLTNQIENIKINKDDYDINYNHLGVIAGNRLIKNTINNYPDITLIMIGDNSPIYVKIKKNRILIDE